ncbi:rRNA adenine N-6-methyltransferase family protein [Polaribacter tangerinus]|uniref:rRNA adenine N-6-methyltransferase family protein n=1 Tax=Polaribacter tangerinus TaxID=1920034 RepID=UPI000B4A7503|nr:rRNA adenine N-6-methyltransferase family protein [Polaribacter tangerinus]
MSFKTSLSFIKNVFTVGAITETDPKTVKEICSKIRSEQDLVIVEFGMGHGNITQEILRRISKNSTLISFEINQDFCAHVSSKINDKRLTIVNDSALNFKNYITTSVDNFIISIPFTFLKNKQAHNLVTSCLHQLKDNGFYSQVVYRDKTLLKSIGNLDFEKKEIKALIKEKIYHVRK